MNSPNHSVIRVAVEHKLKLKQLESIFGTANPSATLGELINLASECGRIDGNIPNTEVRMIADALFVRLEGQAGRTFTHAGAAALIAAIRDAVATTTRNNLRVNIDHGFSIRAVGAGFKLRLSMDGPEKAWPADLVTAFANRIETELQISTT